MVILRWIMQRVRYQSRRLGTSSLLFAELKADFSRMKAALLALRLNEL